jgi:hypothetical protein
LGSSLITYPFEEASVRTIHFDPSLPFLYVPRADWDIIVREFLKTSPATDATAGYSGEMPYNLGGDSIYWGNGCS